MGERKKRRQIEREFGVPFAGEIQAPERWTRTALKKLPAEGPLDLPALFGRSAPLVVDLGCGNGRFLLGSAVWRPDHDHLGIDVLPVVIRYATRRANQRGLTNVRFAVVDALRLLEHYLPSASAAEIHCYHPQPYHDAGQVQRRLVSPSLLALVHRTLVAGGLFCIQTDNAGYWRYIREIVPAFFDFREQLRPWADAPRGRTRREIIALRRGLPVWRGQGTARLDVTPEEARHLAESLPPPTFDAGQPLADLDAIEQLHDGA